MDEKRIREIVREEVSKITATLAPVDEIIRRIGVTMEQEIESSDQGVFEGKGLYNNKPWYHDDAVKDITDVLARYGMTIQQGKNALQEAIHDLERALIQR